MPNPLEPSTSIILLPYDILRDLPIAKDWEGVQRAAQENESLRKRVNKQIGGIWGKSSRDAKSKLKKEALSNKQNFLTLIETFQNMEKEPYDAISDPKGEVTWTKYLDQDQLTEYPLVLNLSPSPTIDEVFQVVKKIVEQFTLLIENKGLWKELWVNGKPRLEKAAQRLFFAVADSYCKANNIDITPEADSGSGPVDFKFSTSYQNRLLVEIKLSTNSKLITGYETQLEAYKLAEGSMRAIYLVIDVGKMGGKADMLLKKKNERIKKGFPVSDIVFIDGTKKLSASKR